MQLKTAALFDVNIIVRQFLTNTLNSLSMDIITNKNADDWEEKPCMSDDVWHVVGFKSPINKPWNVIKYGLKFHAYNDIISTSDMNAKNTNVGVWRSFEFKHT